MATSQWENKANYNVFCIMERECAVVSKQGASAKQKVSAWLTPLRKITFLLQVLLSTTKNQSTEKGLQDWSSKKKSI